MKEFTKEFIEEVNKECPYDQGIFTEPYGLPVKIKEPVIYCRYTAGNFSSGNSCWGSSGCSSYTAEDIPKDRMKVLDIILEKFYPDISFLKFRQIEQLIKTTTDSDGDYYGNSTEYRIEYILVSEFLELINLWEEQRKIKLIEENDE